MSITVKKVGKIEYVYFRYYERGRQIDKVIGRADDPRSWLGARERLGEYRRQEYRDKLKSQMEAVDERITQYFKLTRRRLLQSPEEIQSREKLAEDVESHVSAPRDCLPSSAQR